MNVLDAWTSWSFCFRGCFAENLSEQLCKIFIKLAFIVQLRLQDCNYLGSCGLSWPIFIGNCLWSLRRWCISLWKATKFNQPLYPFCPASFSAPPLLFLMPEFWIFSVSQNRVILAPVLSPPCPHSVCWGRPLSTRCCSYLPAPRHPCWSIDISQA